MGSDMHVLTKMLVVSAKKEYLMLFSGMTQVSMSGEFDNEGTSYQWFDEMFYLTISTVFYEMFQYLCDSLIHQTAIWLSDQKHIFLILNSLPTASMIAATNSDNKTHVMSSRLGIVSTSIGTTIPVPVHKFIVTSWEHAILI